MLRGAIESVTRNRVFGWIWSPDAPVAGRRVLAFLDDACIGAGDVGEFRPDLKEAGLGDGMAGFNFDLTYPNVADAPRVTVRLEGSDTVLVQKRARVMPAAATASVARGSMRAGAPPGTLQWLRSRGWISQSDFDFVRFFRQLGVYDRSLVLAGERAEGAGPPTADAAEVARSLMMLLRLEEVDLMTEEVPHVRALRALAERIELEAGPGVALAVWAPARGRLAVVEGSHQQADLVTPDASPPPAVDYTLGPDRLLFLDARCALGVGATLPAAGVRVMWAAR